MDSRYTWGLLTILVLAIVGGVIAAQNQSGTSAAPAPAPAFPTVAPTPAKNQVFIASGGTGEYSPANLTVHVGQKVTWVNLDSITHSVTADNGAFDQTLSPGEGWSWTPTRPGSYSYSCIFHPEAHGVVTVRP